MKRPVIVSVLVVLIIAVCLHARHRIDSAKEQLHTYANTVFSHIEEDDSEAVKSTVETLVSYWRKEQRYLTLFSRHSRIDEVSRSVARLSSLAAFEEYSDLHAELNAVLWQIDDIKESERIRVGTILI